ncbi:MAG: hypothetical protein JWO38_741 [Gemmataceae bacterium]|nr:hypothetical protein [Gemmataceae bacterium]
MPEATPRRAPLALEATALRYAARDLPPAEAEAFETRLADDQSARDALAEAVRLSAAALGREPPAPDRSFRALIRDRLRPVRAWCPGWLARRAYRGHPVAWAGLGAGVAAASTLVGLVLAGGGAGAPQYGRADSRPAAEGATGPTSDAGPEAYPVAPPPPPAVDDGTHAAAAEPAAPAACGTDDSARKAAEIWAELSTPDHVEKTHEDEARWRQHLRDLHPVHPTHPARPAAFDSHEP